MYPPFISPLRPSGSVPTPARSSGSGGGKRRARSSSSGGRGAQAKLAAAQRIEEIAERADKVCEQIARRVTGPKITDPPRLDERLRRAPDPQGQAAPATELGTVMQITEVCENTRRGVRGLILPGATRIGSPNEHDLLEQSGRRLDALGLRPREPALEGGFAPGPVDQHLPPPDRAFIAGRQSAGSKKTNRRLAKFRVGCEAASATSNDAMACADRG